MKIKSIKILLLCLVLIDFAYAEEVQVSLEKAVELARANSEDYQMASNEAERAEWQYKEVRAAILPKVTTNISYQKYFETSRFGQPLKDYDFTTQVSLQQTLWSFGAVGNAIRAAKAGRELGTLSKENFEQDFVYNVKLAYFTTLLQKHKYDIARESSNATNANLKAVSRGTRGGRLGQSDIIRLQADLAARQAVEKQAELAYRAAELEMKKLLGLGASDTLVLSTSLEVSDTDYSTDEALAELNQKNKSLQVLTKQVEYSESYMKAQRSTMFPSLGAFANLTYGGQSDAASVRSDNLDTTTVAGLSLSWDLFAGGKNYSVYRQAALDKMNAELKLKSLKENLNSELRNALNEVEMLKQVHSSLQASLNYAKRSFEISQRRFRTGQASAGELNDVEQLLTLAKTQAVTALYQMQVAKVQIERLTGK